MVSRWRWISNKIVAINVKKVAAATADLNETFTTFDPTLMPLEKPTTQPAYPPMQSPTRHPNHSPTTASPTNPWENQHSKDVDANGAWWRCQAANPSSRHLLCQLCHHQRQISEMCKLTWRPTMAQLLLLFYTAIVLHEDWWRRRLVWKILLQYFIKPEYFIMLLQREQLLLPEGEHLNSQTNSSIEKPSLTSTKMPT